MNGKKKPTAKPKKAGVVVVVEMEGKGKDKMHDMGKGKKMGKC